MNGRFQRFLSYLFVAVLSCSLTVALIYAATGAGDPPSKLDELSEMIQERFIGEEDVTKMEDAAAAAMVDALGDEWSYYIPASEYANYLDQMSNSYVGVGITIELREDGYLNLVDVVEDGPADRAGLRRGDVLIRVEDQDCAQIGLEQTRNLVRGEDGSQVRLTVQRDGQEQKFCVTRAYFETVVAEGQMVSDRTGLVTIYNFDSRCAEETLAAIDALIEQGAENLIFDVRNNPGGYKTELVKVLDYLLPEGELFRSQYYTGQEEVDRSDAEFLDMPMAVLVNLHSYSAAEFFAAALREYDAAVMVGEHTYGKGYFQQTFELEDGSAVGLSVGKYFTPNGVSLAGVGLTPDLEIPLSEEQADQVARGTMDPQQDPHIQAAIEWLESGKVLDE